MPRAGPFSQRLRRDARRLRVLCSLRIAAETLAAAGTAALAGQLFLPSESARGWFLALILTLGAFLGAFLRRRDWADPVARRWDEASPGAAWAATARMALAAESPGRFAPLLLKKADALAGALPSVALPFEPGVSPGLAIAIVTVAGACLLRAPTEEASPQGASASPPSFVAAGASPPSVPEPEEGSRSVLASHLRLRIVAEPVVAHLGSELTLLLSGEPLVPPSEPIPLRFFLVATDRTPTPDVGFGAGFRAAPLPWQRTLAPASEGPFRELLDLKAMLKGLDLHARGLVSFFVVARTADRRLGFVRSNDITIHLSDNIEKSRSPVPSGVQSTPTAGTPKPEPKPEPQTARTGTDKAESGEEDRLRDAKRRAAAVRPLLAEGPTVEKDVQVFDSEAGAGTARAAADPSPPKVVRTFERTTETAMPELALSPSDRALVARYFSLLRRRP